LGVQKPFDAIEKLVRRQMWAKSFSQKSPNSFFRQTPSRALVLILGPDPSAEALGDFQNVRCADEMMPSLTVRLLPRQYSRVAPSAQHTAESLWLSGADFLFFFMKK